MKCCPEDRTQNYEMAPKSSEAPLGAADATMGDKVAPTEVKDEIKEEQEDKKMSIDKTNPYRNPGNALEEWKKNLNVTEDAKQIKEKEIEEKRPIQDSEVIFYILIYILIFHLIKIKLGKKEGI